jgi:hypothetical protein
MESTALTVTTGQDTPVLHESVLSTSEVVAQVQLIQHVMQEVMQDGEHYGVIPGCGSKPALLKAGAEKLCFTFRLAPDYKVERHDLPSGHREYEVRCELTHIDTGRFIAAGVGLCSSMESKYRWRKAGRKCPECGEEAIIKGKREYGGGWLCFKKKGGCGAKWNDGADVIESQQEGRVENEDIADVFNTVLKMAKKRAHVDATITATAASDIFTQDIGDLPAAVIQGGDGGPEGSGRSGRSEGAPPPKKRNPRRRAPQPVQPTGASASGSSANGSNANQTDAFEDPAEQPDYKARAKKARAWLIGLPAEQFEAAKNRADDEMMSWPAPVREMGAMYVAQAIDKRKQLEQKIQNLDANLRHHRGEGVEPSALRAEVKGKTEKWPQWWRERATAVCEAVIAGVEEAQAYGDGQAPEGALKKVEPRPVK